LEINRLKNFNQYQP